MPIFGLMAFGYGATFTRVFDAAAARALAAFVFYFADSDHAVSQHGVRDAAGPDPVGLSAVLLPRRGGRCSAAGMGLAGAWFGGSFERPRDHRLRLAFGNTVLLGIPLVLTTFGETASLPLFLMVAFHSTLLFTAITVVIEVGRGSREGLRELPLQGRGRARQQPGPVGAARRHRVQPRRVSGCRARSSASRR